MNKRVAYLSLETPREGQASYAHVQEIIRGLRRRGWNVDLYEPAYGRSKRDPNLLERLVGFIETQLRLWISLFATREVIYVRLHPGTFPTALVARLLRIPIVQEVNGTADDVFMAWPWTRRFASVIHSMIRLQLRWASAVVTVTPLLKEWVLMQVQEKRVEVIPNAANTELFNPGAETNRRVPGRYAIFFGALAPWQGLASLLAASERPEWPADLALVVVGDGSGRGMVQRAAERNSRINYLGKLSYSELPGVVARSLMSFSPQYDEVGRCLSTGLYPIKVFESLSCGVPVVVTDYPGQADLVRENHCGLVVRPNDPKALAEAAAYLANNPSQRVGMGERGRRVILSEHSWDKRAADTAALLETLIVGGSRVL